MTPEKAKLIASEFEQLATKHGIVFHGYDDDLWITEKSKQDAYFATFEATLRADELQITDLGWRNDMQRWEDRLKIVTPTIMVNKPYQPILPSESDPFVRYQSEMMSAKGEAGECSSCGTKDGVTFAPDPYASDIHGDDTPVWLCDDCSYQRAMDI